MTIRVLTPAEQEQMDEDEATLASLEAQEKAYKQARKTAREPSANSAPRRSSQLAPAADLLFSRWTGSPVVITAAHCLPHQPPAVAIAGEGERTYMALLAPPQETPSIPALCIFVDAVADIAVLAASDDDISEAFIRLTTAVKPLPVARTANQPPTQWQPAQLIALDGAWFPCCIQGRALSENARPIEGGMSGSPILDTRGRAIGVVTSSCESDLADVTHGPQAILYDDLPARLCRSFRWGRPQNFNSRFCGAGVTSRRSSWLWLISTSFPSLTSHRIGTPEPGAPLGRISTALWRCAT